MLSAGGLGWAPTCGVRGTRRPRVTGAALQPPGPLPPRPLLAGTPLGPLAVSSPPGAASPWPPGGAGLLGQPRVRMGLCYPALGEVAALSSWPYRCFPARPGSHFSAWPRGVRLGSGLGRGSQAPDSAPRCRPRWFRGPCRSAGCGSGPEHPALEPFSNLTGCIQV